MSCVLQVRGLASFGLELDFMVEEYAGSKGRFPPLKSRQQRALYVATIEKGHSLVNSLIEADRLDHLGLLVVDEVRHHFCKTVGCGGDSRFTVVFFLHEQLHMLGDGSRGAVMEMTLAKVLYLSSESDSTFTCFFLNPEVTEIHDDHNFFCFRNNSDCRDERDAGKHQTSADVPQS